jgi:dynein heavy chain 1, cytosolic
MEEIGKSLPHMLMRWRKAETKVIDNDEMIVPVYLNKTRKNLIMSLKVKCGLNKTTLYQNGVAIILWTN